MYDYSHQWIGNPLKFRQAHLEPLWERASSKLEISVSALLYVATKPKARSPMGFLLCGLTRSIGRALAVAVGG